MTFLFGEYPLDNKYLCPECGKELVSGPDCPGYPRVNGVMVCAYPCDNATRFECESCEWWYRYPVGYRSDVGSMGVAPDWMDDYLGEHEHLIDWPELEIEGTI